MTVLPRCSDVDVAMTSGLRDSLGAEFAALSAVSLEIAEEAFAVQCEAIAEETPEFRAGFDFARKLGDHAFRAWLFSIGWESGSAVYPAAPTTTVADVLARMGNQPTSGGWIAVVDPDAEHGFRVLTFAEPSVTR